MDGEFQSGTWGTRQLVRKIWRRKADDGARIFPRLLPSGQRLKPLATLLESLEATARPQRTSWWQRLVSRLFWWRRPARKPTNQKKFRQQNTAKIARPRSTQLSSGEPLEMRLALSTTWVDPHQDMYAQPTAVVDTSSPYTFRLGTTDLDLSAHADLLRGRDVVVEADESAGNALGHVVIGSLSGLASLDVRVPASVTLTARSR